MENSTFLCDAIVQNLKREKGFEKYGTAEINGFHFSAADSALPDGEGNCQVYRIARGKAKSTKKLYIRRRMPKFMADVEEMANRLCGQSIFEIEGIKDIENPVELNAFIIIMNNGKKYLVEVFEYTEED